MKLSSGQVSQTEHQIAQALLFGFNKHYMLFRESCRDAKACYDDADWIRIHTLIKDRIRYYDLRVREAADRLANEFEIDKLDENNWNNIKLMYIGLLLDHKQPELAETFFNSVVTRSLHRNYFNNRVMFVRPAISTEFIQPQDDPVYRSYYAEKGGLRGAIARVLVDFKWKRKFADVKRDAQNIHQAVVRHLGSIPRREDNFQIQVLHSAFFRNKAAYIIGKAINGHLEVPFAAPVLVDENGELYVDTILLDSWRISSLFSLSRAYFMVDMEIPSAYVQFLRNIMPGKPRSELYIMLGLGKQGKTMFYRSFVDHLHHSADKFIMAPGIRGLVMLVFTLPSYPYVFKIIKDVFGSSKDMDRATVKRKFTMVKQVDRVGRMADTLEFSNVALPLKRFDQELLEEMQKLAPSSMEINGANLIIKHLYIERRMEPMNIYVERMERSQNQEALEHCVREYGNAIRELAQANIFPGDMLWKNFGITRFGRVVFYDYDEIEYMTDINFRKIPPAPSYEQELSGEPWYSVAKNDVFPEEFITFLLSSIPVRKLFMKHHADLVTSEFWQKTQVRIREGYVEDFYPYPEELRFVHHAAKSKTNTGTNTGDNTANDGSANTKSN